jgi:predicted metal-dependent enzyme (double-stranded beta helix superfamily)
MLITCLQHFFTHSQNNYLHAFVPILRNLDLSCFKSPRFVETGKYSREIIHQDKAFEIVRISWGSQSATDFHRHPMNGCIINVLQGKLVEQRFSLNAKSIQSTLLEANHISYMHNKYGMHRVTNPTENISQTLHIYSPINFY